MLYDITILLFRSEKMKKQLARAGIIIGMVTVGFLLLGCTSMGPVQSGPPDGTYYSYTQGTIIFDTGDNSWEAPAMGYKGSFDFNGNTSAITLNADQKLQGLQWVSIDPVPGFINGEVKEEGKTLILGAFTFTNYDD
jgi:hypothetical protein